MNDDFAYVPDGLIPIELNDGEQEALKRALAIDYNAEVKDVGNLLGAKLYEAKGAQNCFCDLCGANIPAGEAILEVYFEDTRELSPFPGWVCTGREPCRFRFACRSPR